MFEPDEFIVKRFFNFIKQRKKNTESALNHIAYLDELKSRLTLVSRAVTGNAIEIFEAEREGGYKDNNFFLPKKYLGFETKEENIEFYLFRVLFLSIQQKLGLNFLVSNDQGLAYAQLQAKEHSAQILNVMFEDFPVTKGIYKKLIDYYRNVDKKKGIDESFIYGKWMNNSQKISQNNELKHISNKVKEAIQSEIRSIKKANAVEEVQSLIVDKKQQEDFTLIHKFEKVETAEEWEGGWRDFDGEDDLDEHSNALEEINMRYTVRVDDPVHSVYQSEFVENISIGESAEIESSKPQYFYDEWDYKLNSYKSGFCKVFTTQQVETNAVYYQTTVAQNRRILQDLRKLISSINNRYHEQKRQNQGDDFDIDASTDLFVDIYSRHTPQENIYIAKRKHEKDLSILMLLDISLSSDSYAANNRILDIEKQVSIMFGQILEEFNVDFAVDGFYSKTRNYCYYHTIKGFDDAWEKSKFKIGGLHPQGYTRIGPALRHAGALLKTRNTNNKWVILLSDGKPNDYDKYEGKYGINDVKQAIRELNKEHIQAYAIAIEAEPKYYLPQMFGENHYQTITNPHEMISALVKLYEKTKFH